MWILTPPELPSLKKTVLRHNRTTYSVHAHLTQLGVVYRETGSVLLNLFPPFRINLN